MQVGQTLGPFVIDKVLGSGAMGTVYRARYPEKKVRVAIKVVGAGLLNNPAILARFDREIKILKQLDHPNIVRYLGSGRSQGSPWYAMEYIEGESLDHVLARRQRFSWEDVITLGQQVCDALQHAHEKGIIHRDLKPSNLMILPDQTVKLTDFGIAKDVDRTELTATHCTVGTASYMSPEQCRGSRDLTFKSDLYSLGVVFFELLTGRKPFFAETPLEMFKAHIEQEPERVSRLVPECPVWLDTLVAQMLEKDPDRRPRDAAIIAQILGEIDEKVRAQQSAGVEAARRRRVDRSPHAPKADETDREAARALTGKTKKRSKKKKVPWYQRAWVRAVGLGAALLVVVGLLVGILMSINTAPSLDSLYSRAERLMASGTPEDRDRARNGIDGPLDLFLKHHAQNTDSRAIQMRAWVDEIDGAEKQRMLDKFVLHAEGKGKVEPQTETEKLATHAAFQEVKGNYDAAKAGWQDLHQKTPASGSDRPWHLMAGARLKTFERADQEVTRLAEIAALPDDEPRDALGNPLLKTDLEKDAVKALKQEKKGNKKEAEKTWGEIKEKVANDLGQRPWYYMALKKEKELKASGNN